MIKHYVETDLFLSKEANIKFDKGAKEHCKCGVKDLKGQPFPVRGCKCWDSVDYKVEAMEECYDLFNYVSKGLNKFNPPEKINDVIDEIYILFHSILMLEGSGKKNGRKTV